MRAISDRAEVLPDCIYGMRNADVGAIRTPAEF